MNHRLEAETCQVLEHFVSAFLWILWGSQRKILVRGPKVVGKGERTKMPSTQVLLRDLESKSRTSGEGTGHTLQWIQVEGLSSKIPQVIYLVWADKQYSYLGGYYCLKFHSKNDFQTQAACSHLRSLSDTRCWARTNISHLGENSNRLSRGSAANDGFRNRCTRRMCLLQPRQIIILLWPIEVWPWVLLLQTEKHTEYGARNPGNIRDHRGKRMKVKSLEKE